MTSQQAEPKDIPRVLEEKKKEYFNDLLVRYLTNVYQYPDETQPGTFRFDVIGKSGGVEHTVVLALLKIVSPGRSKVWQIHQSRHLRRLSVLMSRQVTPSPVGLDSWSQRHVQ